MWKVGYAGIRETDTDGIEDDIYLVMYGQTNFTICETNSFDGAQIVCDALNLAGFVPDFEKCKGCVIGAVKQGE